MTDPDRPTTVVATPVDKAAKRRATAFSVLTSPRALWRYLRDPAVGWGPRIAVFVALAYIVFPFDAVPDVLPVLGWLDDLGVGTLVAAWIARKTAAHENASLAASADTPAPPTTLTAP
ncbi:MAG: YkvA family protein [Deltaproteobacteria bacterium]|nr:YkvA family protein [Deltaproteobacteria bacterium]